MKNDKNDKNDTEIEIEHWEDECLHNTKKLTCGDISFGYDGSEVEVYYVLACAENNGCEEVIQEGIMSYKATDSFPSEFDPKTDVFLE